jgi:hypothetical protein
MQSDQCVFSCRVALLVVDYYYTNYRHLLTYSIHMVEHVALCSDVDHVSLDLTADT